jgi:crotonobetainyl-CoA:carnitine CoA-transferase CaiB-like acyl-CoA transferase
MHPDTIDIYIDLPGGCMPASHEAASGGPLDGIRVLDLSSVVMGPLATQILGDLGADVITVETRDGDINRIMGSGPCPGLSGVSLNLLRNKRNISLDIAHPDGRAALLRVAAGYDVFVTNLRPGSVGRLRLRYPDIAAIRPDVIYCQAHGFPSDSPQADAPAFDDIIQAACGVPDVLRRASGRPGLMPTLLADKVSGLASATPRSAGCSPRRPPRNGWRSARTPGFRPPRRPGWTSSSTRCPRTNIRRPDGTR